MNWLLLRHADAELDAPSDLERALSKKGHLQAETLAQWFPSYRCRPNLILSSTAIRAWQTAEPIAAALRVECLPCPWARPGMSPESAIENLESYASLENLMLVGHQPDLSLLAAQLLGAIEPTSLHVRKASTLHLKILSKASARLEAFIPCPSVS